MSALGGVAQGVRGGLAEAKGNSQKDQQLAQGDLGLILQAAQLEQQKRKEQAQAAADPVASERMRARAAELLGGVEGSDLPQGESAVTRILDIGADVNNTRQRSVFSRQRLKDQRAAELNKMRRHTQNLERRDWQLVLKERGDDTKTFKDRIARLEDATQLLANPNFLDQLDSEIWEKVRVWFGGEADPNNLTDADVQKAIQTAGGDMIRLNEELGKIGEAARKRVVAPTKSRRPSAKTNASNEADQIADEVLGGGAVNKILQDALDNAKKK